MRDAITAMRDAFAQLSRGEVTLPTRLRLDAPAEHGAALIMPCHSQRGADVLAEDGHGV